MEQQDTDSSPPTMQDSDVGGNMHTGDVIHNHYHVGTETPQPEEQTSAPAQQPAIMN